MHNVTHVMCDATQSHACHDSFIRTTQTIGLQLSFLEVSVTGEVQEVGAYRGGWLGKGTVLVGVGGKWKVLVTMRFDWLVCTERGREGWRVGKRMCLRVFVFVCVKN